MFDFLERDLPKLPIVPRTGIRMEIRDEGRHSRRRIVLIAETTSNGYALVNDGISQSLLSFSEDLA